MVGVAIGMTSQYDAAGWPFLLVLLVSWLNGTAFLAFSSIAERTGRHPSTAGRDRARPGPVSGLG